VFPTLVKGLYDINEALDRWDLSGILADQYAGFASQLSEKSQKELQLLIQSYPKELQGFVKDAVMSGTLTTEANQKMGHALGGTMNQVLGIRETESRKSGPRFPDT